MKRRKLANGIMVLLILVIGAAGVLTAGFIRGWFDRDTEAATLTELRGVVTMKRDGVAYPVEPNTCLLYTSGFVSVLTCGPARIDPGGRLLRYGSDCSAKLTKQINSLKEFLL